MVGTVSDVGWLSVFDTPLQGNRDPDGAVDVDKVHKDAVVSKSRKMCTDIS